MSMQSIHSILFSITKLNEKAYQLDTVFLDATASSVSKKTAVFIQQKPLGPDQTLDVYSQNGKCCDPPSNLFKNKHLQLLTSQDEIGIKSAAQKMQTVESLGLSVLVLDMKDENASYLDRESIIEAEETICDFYKQPSVDPGYLTRAKKVHALFQTTLPLDFVLCEGALKCNILKNFSEPEAEFLLHTKKGAIAFCQYAEFYMNSFKFGQETRDSFAEDYFRPVSSRFDAFQPQSKNTTWYPAAYKEIYSPRGEFFQVLKPIFSISGELDEARAITSISMEMKS
ncbi:MAG: hypothetical protein KGZ39_08165 [Simkania sp.]|nr:hypothetical protein [Simkania sp.]